MSERPTARNGLMSRNGIDSQDQLLRLVTGGIFGTGAGDDVEGEIVRFGKAVDGTDWLQGTVCQATGYTAPRSRIVYVDGKPFIDVFAPERVDK